MCVGVVSHRRLQVEQPEEIAATIRQALKYIPPERLIVSTDCGFGRQGCNRDIAFFKTVSIVELGFSGNVLREIYRVSLENGSALDVATGKITAK